MSEKTIKPCPFCGKKVEVYNFRDSKGKMVYFVSCDCNPSDLKYSKKEAIESWNRRAK